MKQSLDELGIKYDVAYHPNEFLIIRLLNNPVMIPFDERKALKLFLGFMERIKALDSKAKEKEERKEEGKAAGKEEEVAVFVEDPYLILEAEQKRNDLLFAQELDKNFALEEERQRQDLLLAEQLEKQFAEEIAKEKEQQLLEDEKYARSLALGF